MYSFNIATHTLSPLKKPSHISLLFTGFSNWWTDPRTDPFRCSLILLVFWQIVPVLILSRHSATVHLHYLLITLPGQFILIGFFLSRAISWFQLQQTVRYGTSLATTLLLVTQLAGSTASLLDTTRGINNHIFGYNDLGSLQNALAASHYHYHHHHHSVSPPNFSLPHHIHSPRVPSASRHIAPISRSKPSIPSTAVTRSPSPTQRRTHPKP